MSGTSSSDALEITQKGLSRRSALKKIGLLIAGIGIVSVGGAAVFETLTGAKQRTNSATLTNQNNESTILSSSSTTSQISISSDSSSSFIIVKTAYFGMSTQLQGVKGDYITLKSPASLGDAIDKVAQLRPALLPMIGAMQIMIDGNPAEPNQRLSNMDEIDFIAIQAGG